MFEILLVEDEPIIRKGLHKIIESSSVDIAGIRTAENGEEAIERIREKPPHFLFTDIRMAKMDGLELCRKVYEEYPHILKVIITGYSDFEYARTGISLGVKEYILKPITRKSIQEVLQRLADEEMKRRKALPSLAQSNNWVTRMTEAFWTLDEQAVFQNIHSFLDQFENAGMSIEQRKIIVGELWQVIVNRLRERTVDVLSSPEDWEGIHSSEGLNNRLLELAQRVSTAIRVKRRGRAKDPIEEAKKYIEDNLSRDFSLEEVAELLGLNASYFSQLFKQATGQTFAHYRIGRRMERAKLLLADPNRKITDISYDVGYADHPHFTKTFKKITGLTPKEYREKLGVDP